MFRNYAFGEYYIAEKHAKHGIKKEIHRDGEIHERLVRQSRRMKVVEAKDRGTNELLAVNET